MKSAAAPPPLTERERMLAEQYDLLMAGLEAPAPAQVDNRADEYAAAYDAFFGQGPAPAPAARPAWADRVPVAGPGAPFRAPDPRSGFAEFGAGFVQSLARALPPVGAIGGVRERALQQQPPDTGETIGEALRSPGFYGQAVGQAVTTAPALALGPGAGLVALVPLASQAAEEKRSAVAASGGSEFQQVASGAGAGAIEAATEYLPIPFLKGLARGAKDGARTIGQRAAQLLGIGGLEGAEEVGNTIGTNVVDAMAGLQTWEEAARKIVVEAPVAFTGGAIGGLTVGAPVLLSTRQQSVRQGAAPAPAQHVPGGEAQGQAPAPATVQGAAPGVPDQPRHAAGAEPHRGDVLARLSTANLVALAKQHGINYIQPRAAIIADMRQAGIAVEQPGQEAQPAPEPGAEQPPPQQLRPQAQQPEPRQDVGVATAQGRLGFQQEGAQQQAQGPQQQEQPATAPAPPEGQPAPQRVAVQPQPGVETGTQPAAIEPPAPGAARADDRPDVGVGQPQVADDGGMQGHGAPPRQAESSTFGARDESLRQRFRGKSPEHAAFEAQVDRAVAEGAFSGAVADVVLAGLETTEADFLSRLALRTERVVEAGSERAGRTRFSAEQRRGVPARAEITIASLLSRMNEDPGQDESVRKLGAEASHVFFEEFGHAAHLMLVGPEAALTISAVYQSRTPREWEAWFAERRNSAHEGGYPSSTEREFLAHAFADWMLSNRVPDERLRPLLARLGQWFKRAIERLKGHPTIDRLVPIFEQMQRGVPVRAGPISTKGVAPQAVLDKDRGVPQPGTPWPARTPVGTEPVEGDRGEIVLPDGRRLPFVYAVVSASDIIPTHDARRRFSPNQTGDSNERPYHDKEAGKPSREAVGRMADTLDPMLLLTDTPTATDGPPITTPDLRVVGGNARAMALQLAYGSARARPGAQRYAQEVRARAQRFGIDPARITMQEPVLVRRLVGEPGVRGELSRVLNESLTTGRTREADAVSRGRMVSPEVAERVSEKIGESSLAQALEGRRGFEIAMLLRDAGVFSPSDMAQFLAAGELTREGKLAVERTLLGSIIPDVGLMDETPDSAKAMLLRSAGTFLRLRQATAKGTDLDIDRVLADALHVLALVRATKSEKVRFLLEQGTITPEPALQNPRGVALAEAIEEGKPIKFAERMRRLHEAVADALAGNMALGQTEPLTAGQAFDAAFGIGELGGGGFFGQKIHPQSAAAAAPLAAEGMQERVPVSSFTIGTTGDAVTGDVVLFTEGVFSGSYKNPKHVGERRIAAKIVNDSYGADKQQHTFTLEVLWSDGASPLAPGTKTTRKGRNVYRNGTQRQPWPDEAARLQAADEKHGRGDAARGARDRRRQEDERFGQQITPGQGRLREPQPATARQRVLAEEVSTTTPETGETGAPDARQEERQVDEQGGDEGALRPAEAAEQREEGGLPQGPARPLTPRPPGPPAAAGPGLFPGEEAPAAGGAAKPWNVGDRFVIDGYPAAQHFRITGRVGGDAFLIQELNPSGTPRTFAGGTQRVHEVPREWFADNDARRPGAGEAPSPTLAADDPQRPGESDADYRLRLKFREAERNTGSLFGQRIQTDTPAFKRWFRKSKVVDERGLPRVVYHQTSEEAERGILEGGGFDINRPRARKMDEGMPDGVFMKPDDRDIGLRKGAQMPLYASIQNPLIVKDRAELAAWARRDPLYAKFADDTRDIDRVLADALNLLALVGASDAGEALGLQKALLDESRPRIHEAAANARRRLTKRLREQGYDGVIVAHDAGTDGRWTETIVALDPRQVKSATKNVGTFDPDTADIRYGPPIRPRGPDALGFYSKLEKFIGEKIRGPMPRGQALRSMLNGGMSPDELRWTGLEELLSARPEKPVTPAALTRYLAENRVELREVVKGGRTSAENAEFAAAVRRFDVAAQIAQRSLDGFDVNAWHNFEAATAWVEVPWETAFESFLRPYDSTQAARLRRRPGLVEAFVEMHEASKILRRAPHSPTDETRFGPGTGYTLPGGETYREVLLVLPKRPYTPQASPDSLGRFVNDPGPDFRSDHFPEPNIVAHLRLNDRTLADGRRVLFAEEIQSDWHEQGRDQGYRAPWSPAEEARFRELQVIVKDAGKRSMTPEVRAELEGLDARWQAATDDRRVPPAPFAKTWHEMAFRRLMRLAAEGGYDAVAWTKGEQQIERYEGAARDVERVVWEEWNQTLTAFGASGRQLVRESNVARERLGDYIGKEAAEALLASTPTESPNATGGPPQRTYTLSDRPVRVGGQGMRSFYDRDLVKYAAKFGKRWGVAPETGRIYVGEKAGLGADAYAVRDAGETTEVHVLPVNEAMRASVMEEGTQLFGPRINPKGQPIPGLSLPESSPPTISEQEARWVAEAAGKAERPATQPLDSRAHRLLARMIDYPAGVVQAGVRAAELRLRTAAGAVRTMGPEARALADEIHKVNDESLPRSGKDWDDIHEALRLLPKRAQELAMKWMNGRVEDDLLVPEGVKAAGLKVRAVLDGQMRDANAAGARREGKELGGIGHAFPEGPNEDGERFILSALQNGLADMEVAAWAEAQAKKGRAASPEDALARLAKWQADRLRGKNTYFESYRVRLPEQYVEWDPDTVLPAALLRNAQFISALRVWGADKNGVAFPRAAARIQRIAARQGAGEAGLVARWFQSHFGGQESATRASRRVFGAINNYETITKLGFSWLSALRNMGQRYTNTIRYGLGPVMEATRRYPPFLSGMLEESRKIRRIAQRAGAVQPTEITAIDKESPGGTLAERSLRVSGFAPVEEGNKTFTSLVASIALQRDIDRLMQKGGPSTRFGRILEMLLTLALDPRAAAHRRLQAAGMSDERIVDILSGEKASEEDIERAMIRVVGDTQFTQTLATEPLWWRTSPGGRLFWKFKTFGTRQIALIYRDVAKEALKGNFGPMLRWLIAMLITGELYQLARDLLLGDDESLVKGLFDGVDQDGKEWAARVMNSLRNGGGLGLASDLTYGFLDFLGGPTLGSLRNLASFVDEAVNTPAEGGPSNLVAAAKEFATREVPAVRQVMGAVDAADRAFLNSANRAKAARVLRARVRSFTESAREQARGVGAVRATASRTLRDVLLGQPDYQEGPWSLSLRQAAAQIDAGDEKDAAAFLRRAMQAADTPAERASLALAIRASRQRRSPLGALPKSRARAFLAGLKVGTREGAVEMQKDWLAAYDRALKSAGVGTMTRSPGGP